MTLKRDHYVVVNKSQRPSTESAATETVNNPTAAPVETATESPAAPVAAAAESQQ